MISPVAEKIVNRNMFILFWVIMFYVLFFHITVSVAILYFKLSRFNGNTVINKSQFFERSDYKITLMVSLH